MLPQEHTSHKLHNIFNVYKDYRGPKKLVNKPGENFCMVNAVSIDRHLERLFALNYPD